MSQEVARVCLYDRSMAEAFDRFCRIIWPSSGRGTSTSTVSVDRIPECPTFVFLKGAEIIGHVTTIPVHLSASNQTIAAHWIVGFMVLPEHRNGLVGPLLIREVNRSLDYALSLHVEPPVLRILTGLKWVHKGVLPQYLRVLNARGVAENLQVSGIQALASDLGSMTGGLRFRWIESLMRVVGWCSLAIGGTLWVVVTSVVRPRIAKADVREERMFDESYDQLWHMVGKHFEACFVRDRASLQAKFGPHGERYRILACRRGGQLLGYCIIKTKQFANDSRMGNLKMGTIVDCLFDPTADEVLQTLLEHVVALFAREGVHAVLCTASHRLVRRLLLANGFFPIPGNLNFAFHTRASVLLQDIPLDGWHLMRGDSDADQNF